MALVTSIITGGSNNHTTSSEEANAYATDFVSQGIVGSFTNTLYDFTPLELSVIFSGLSPLPFLVQ